MRELMMIKLKSHERNRASLDLSTPEERMWLDRLETVRPDMAPLMVHYRENDGNFHTLTCLFRRKRIAGSAFGCYIVDLEWVKLEVLRLEKEYKENEQLEIDNMVGSMI